MKCELFEIRLADYLDDVLGADERVDLEVHASECPSCGPLFRDATEGLQMLRTALPVEPPPDLLTHLSYSAPAGRFRQSPEPVGHSQRQGVKRWLRTLWEPLLQPRLAMSMAMTILSFAMLERCTGVHVQHVTAADLNPVHIWSGLEERTLRLRDRAVKYYENLRWVYELEVQLGALGGQSDADNRRASHARSSGDEKDRESKDTRK